MLRNVAYVCNNRNQAERSGTDRNPAERATSTNHPPPLPRQDTTERETMSITKHDLRDILDETANDKALRSRIEKLAGVDKSGEEQRTFIDMVTRLNAALADAAGVKPRKIDPTVTVYRVWADDGLVYRVGSCFIGVSTMLEYQNVASIKVCRNRWGDEIAHFFVEPLGPEGAVALAVACVDHLNGEKPE